MTDFSCYPCWEPTVAAATLSTEAVSPSPSVFFATHAPLRIHRRLPGTRLADGDSTPVDEEEVRRDFLSRPTAGGVLLMPVIGQSGTGKSHLVRWIKEKTDSSSRRQIIYLPKTRTSLKAVIKELLAEVEGNELAQLKADVDRMSSEVDQAGLERRLLAQLNEALAAAPPVTGSARVLAGPGRLAVLLLDPHVRSYLLRPERLIPRLAAQLLADRRPGESDRPLSFTAEDLPLDMLDPGQASAAARKMLTLIKGRPELQAAALAMLNEQLPAAVINAANIGPGRLQNAMLEIRREFARQDKEIILLIEDFALIQGIQRDLLDAIIEVGERDGQQVLAPVRTLMAVTTGYYDRLVDTVLTRARAATPYVYDLDVQFDPDDETMGEVTAFVGRYMNAARLGRAALDAANVRSADSAPNACDRCQYREECHTAFGVSPAGHGIYPFNQSALRRAIRARAPRGSSNAFNPRAVIGEVVRNVLVEHVGALTDGKFPAARFAAEYPTAASERPLPGSVREALENLDPLDYGRRITFLELWGDAPPAPVNLAPGLQHAFDVSTLDLTDEEPRPEPTTTPDPAPGSGPQLFGSELPNSARRMIGDIEEWVTRDTVLRQNTAGALRGIIRDAVAAGCLWNDPLMPEPTAEVWRRAWPAKSIVISITGAAAENLPGTDKAPIQFPRTPNSSVFFQHILRAQAGQIPGNAQYIRRLSAIADRHQRDFRDAMQRGLAVTEADLVLAIRTSLIGALLAGRAWPGMDEAALLAAALDEGQGWAHADRATRTPQWIAAWERHRAARPDLIDGIQSGFGVSRGVRGDVRMIDAARALPLLRAAAKSWEWQTPDAEPPSWARRAMARLSELGSLVDGQLTLLAGQLEQIRSYISVGTRSRDTVDAVAAALAAGESAGLAPQDKKGFADLVADAGARNWPVIEQLERDLGAARSPDTPAGRRRTARIIAAGRDRGEDLAILGDFLATADQWLTGALADAAMREGGAGVAAATHVQDMLQRWSQIGRGDASE